MLLLIFMPVRYLFIRSPHRNIHERTRSATPAAPPHMSRSNPLCARGEFRWAMHRNRIWRLLLLLLSGSRLFLGDHRVLGPTHVADVLGVHLCSGGAAHTSQRHAYRMPRARNKKCSSGGCGASQLLIKRTPLRDRFLKRLGFLIPLRWAL